MQSEALESALKHRQDLAATKKDIERQISDIDAALEEYLVTKGIESEKAGRFTVRMITGTRYTLDKTRLVEMGVLPNVINSATKVTTYTSLRVTADAGE